MAIAFYCEDEDPKMLYNGSSQAYYESAYGYHPHNHHHHPQQSQHGVAVGPQQHQHAGSGEGTAVDENNNNCTLHGSGGGGNGAGGGKSGGSSGEVQNDAAATVHSSNRQLMRVLHQVLYRYTMEGVLGPDQTSCLFCNRIYYLFQLLY